MPKVKQTLKNQKNQKKNKFWNFINNEDEGNAELYLYHDISSNESWWDDVVTADNFKEELKNLGEKEEITVRINSCGGDVFAASTIYSLLKDNSASITVKIDGFCASAATIVAMAGDKICISPAGMFMIHDPLSGLMGYYNAKELKEIATTLDKVKESIMNTYLDRTSKSKEELDKMMEDSTWMSPDEALEDGFVDEIMFKTNDEEDETIFDGQNIIINSVSMDISKFKTLPTNLIKNMKIKNSSSNFTMNSSFFNSKKNKKEMEADKVMDKNELKNKYPDIFNEVKKEGMQEERERIKNIDELSMPGYEEILNKAKFESGITAEMTAMEIVKAQKEKGSTFLENREKEVLNSNVNKVNGTVETDKTEDEEKKVDSVLDKLFGKDVK